MKLENNGSFSLKNLGKRHILVNGEKLNTGQIGTLASCSSINVSSLAYALYKRVYASFYNQNSNLAV